MKEKVIERSERHEYGERILHIRNKIYQRITKVPSFLKNVQDTFKAYHFNSFDKELKIQFDAAMDQNDLVKAHSICLQLSPKFSKIFHFFEEKYEDKELNSLIDEFYILANIYFESYRNLIHKLIHDNPQASFLNYMDAFSDSYHIVLYTLSLYDYRIAEFGTLLGKNMYHMIRTNVKAIIKRQEIPIDCVPPSLLKDSANFENIEEEIASLIEDNFTVGSDEYIVGKMMICDNHDVASIAETLKKPNSIIASIKKMIVRKLKKNPKAMTIIRELTDKK